MGKDNLANYLGGNVEGLFKKAFSGSGLINDIEEIRLRTDKPALVYIKGREYGLSPDLGLTRDIGKSYITKQEDIKKTLELMSNFSLYALEEEMRNGYITLPGGHRVGISGKVSLENSGVKTISAVSGLNIRVSRQINGCAGGVIEHIAKPALKHTLIISPPACGKTTLVRDIGRQLSQGFPGFAGVTVGIVDERSEIAGSFQGIPQNDVGPRTDVLDGCPKAEGMIMLLRSMAPSVIIADEIGSDKDIYAIESVINAGVKIICTIHGLNLADVMAKPGMDRLMGRRIFELYIVLSRRGGPGSVEGVYDANCREVSDCGS